MLMSKVFGNRVNENGFDLSGTLMLIGPEKEAAIQAILNHDSMAELLCNHRAFFEGIIEHAPEGTPVDHLEMYRGFIEQIDEVLNHG